MKKYILLVFILFAGLLTEAHEVRPAYLQIHQVDDSTYQVLWKIPAMGELAPPIYPRISGDWERKLIESRMLPGAARHEWYFFGKGGIRGEQIFIEGVSNTIIDVLINIRLLDGEEFTAVLRADEPVYEIPGKSSFSDVAITYTVLGIEHILFGIDHLLFVLALMMITSGKWRIIKTVTAFTIAHSITLSLAALGLVSIPIPPVEAIIALSIVFLCIEILKHRKGEESLTYRNPWVVAFAFGLLHGFGFASALSETGLPSSNIPAALAFFNIGVELGQIAFVMAILLVLFLLKPARIKWPSWALKAPVYLIGGLSSYWLIDRIVGFWL